MSETCAIGLGSNLGDRVGSLHTAAEALRELGHSLRLSPLYQTAPVGPPQPDFLNGVVVMTTELSAQRILNGLLQIERRLGRERNERWGPRLIDLDLLVLGEQRLTSPGLTVPHPEIARRAFVLQPWSDLTPEMQVPGVGKVAELLAWLPSDERTGVSFFVQDW